MLVFVLVFVRVCACMSVCQSACLCVGVLVCVDLRMAAFVVGANACGSCCHLANKIAKYADNRH